MIEEGTDCLRISGAATNGNPFKVKAVIVSGALLDIRAAGGHRAGRTVRFDVHVKKEAFVSYQLYALAERDGE